MDSSDKVLQKKLRKLIAEKKLVKVTDERTNDDNYQRHKKLVGRFSHMFMQPFMAS